MEKILEYFIDGEDEDYEEYNKLADEKPKYSSLFRVIAKDSQRHASYFRRLLLGDDVRDYPAIYSKIKVPRFPEGHGFYDEKIREEIIAVKSYLAFGDEHKEFKSLMYSIVTDEIKHIGFLKDIKDGKDIEIHPLSNPIAFNVLLASSVGSIIATLLAAAIISYDVREFGKKSLFHKATTAVVEKVKKKRNNPPINWNITGNIGRLVASKGNKKVVVTKTSEKPYRFKFYKGENKLLDVEYEDSDVVLDLVTSLVTEEPDRVFSSIENVYEGEPLDNQSVFLPMLLTNKRVVFDDSMEDIVQLNPGRRLKDFHIIGKLIQLDRKTTKRYEYYWATLKLSDGSFAGGPIYTMENFGKSTRPLQSPIVGHTVRIGTGVLKWELNVKHNQYYVHFSCTMKHDIDAPYTPSPMEYQNMYSDIVNAIGLPPGDTGGSILKPATTSTPTPTPTPMPTATSEEDENDREYFSDDNLPPEGSRVYLDTKKLDEYLDSIDENDSANATKATIGVPFPGGRTTILNLINGLCGERKRYEDTLNDWTIATWFYEYGTMEKGTEDKRGTVCFVSNIPKYVQMTGNETPSEWPNNGGKHAVFLTGEWSLIPTPYPANVLYTKLNEVKFDRIYLGKDVPLKELKYRIDTGKQLLLYPSETEKVNEYWRNLELGREYEVVNYVVAETKSSLSLSTASGMREQFLIDFNDIKYLTPASVAYIQWTSDTESESAVEPPKTLEPSESTKYIEPIEYPPITVDFSGAIWNPKEKPFFRTKLNIINNKFSSVGSIAIEKLEVLNSGRVSVFEGGFSLNLLDKIIFDKNKDFYITQAKIDSFPKMRDTYGHVTRALNWSGKDINKAMSNINNDGFTNYLLITATEDSQTKDMTKGIRRTKKGYTNEDSWLIVVARKGIAVVYGHGKADKTQPLGTIPPKNLMPTLRYSNTFRLKGSEVVDFVDKALKTTNLKPESDEPDEPEPKPEPEPKQPSKPYVEPIEYPPITVDFSGAIWNPNVANNNYIVMKKIFRRNFNGSN